MYIHHYEENAVVKTTRNEMRRKRTDLKKAVNKDKGLWKDRDFNIQEHIRKLRKDRKIGACVEIYNLRLWTLNKEHYPIIRDRLV